MFRHYRPSICPARRRSIRSPKFSKKDHSKNSDHCHSQRDAATSRRSSRPHTVTNRNPITSSKTMTWRRRSDRLDDIKPQTRNLLSSHANTPLTWCRLSSGFSSSTTASTTAATRSPQRTRGSCSSLQTSISLTYYTIMSKSVAE